MSQEMNEAINAIYRERNTLVAHLAAVYPSALAWNDPDEPDWAVVYIETEAGQLSWHVSPDDIDLFKNVERKNIVWDGHDTDIKYSRLRYMTELVRARG